MAIKMDRERETPGYASFLNAEPLETAAAARLQPDALHMVQLTVSDERVPKTTKHY